MATIRRALPSDIGVIVDMGKEAIDSTSYTGIPINEQKCRRLVVQMMNAAKTCVWVVADDQDQAQGFLLGAVDDLFFSDAWFATDIATYVRPGFRRYGFRLIRRFIEWAKTFPKVIEISMAIASGHQYDDRVGRLYEHMGLQRVGGLHVMRVVKHEQTMPISSVG